MIYKSNAKTSLKYGYTRPEIVEHDTNEHSESFIETLELRHPIIEKIHEGKMKKLYSEVTLLNQNYILDPDKTVNEIIQEQSKNKFVILSFNILSL